MAARRIDLRQHARQDVEVAGAADPPPGGVDRGQRRVGWRSDQTSEQADESRRALQRLAQGVDAGRLVFAGARELSRRGEDGLLQRGAAMQPPRKAARAGHDDELAALARLRSANFCTLPVEVFGISSKTTRRGHL